MDPADPASDWLRDRVSDVKCLKIFILSFSTGKIVDILLFYSSFYGSDFTSWLAHRLLRIRLGRQRPRALLRFGPHIVLQRGARTPQPGLLQERSVSV